MSDDRARLILDRYLPLRTFPGGMGVVHLCADVTDRRAVALKTFRPELLADAALREAFVREASTWMRIGEHPNVVAARQVLRGGESVYVVCDVVVPPEEARSPALRAWLGRPLPPARALRWALGIVRGMSWATARVPGLVHRDLKPENVLVGRDLEARVTDFGLAITDPAKADASGTPGYMAPEQLEGRADVRSDVYAFGLVLLEMLTGSTGINRGASRREILDGHVRGQPAQHAERAPLADALRPLVLACVARDPAARPASWSDVEARLLAAWPQVVDGPPPPPREGAEASGDARLLALWSELALANALQDLARYGDAGSGYAALLARARAAGARALEAAALSGLAQIDTLRGEVARAIEGFDASLAIRRELGDRAGEARTIANRANAVARLGRHEEALAGHDLSMRLFFELGRRAEYTAARFNTVPMLTALRRAEEAIHQAAWCRDAFREDGNVRAEGVALGALGQAYRFVGRLDESLVASTEALACFRRVADRAREAGELALQGATLRALDRHTEALDAYGVSLELAEQIGDRFLLGRVRYALADMTPSVPRFAKLGARHAAAAAEAYRAAGREELARDADALGARFAAVPAG